MLVHLASALLVRREFDGLVFASHDVTLGIAASANGFRVHGISIGA